MDIIEILGKEELDRLLTILRCHQSLLSEVKSSLSELVADNEEVFRRDPLPRLKRLRSIQRKIYQPHMTADTFFAEMANLSDIAGIRLTIGTKEQHTKAAEKVRTTLAYLGEIRESGDWRRMRPDGYCANHLVLRAPSFKGAHCEIQIRTLTQDLWAVFSHYEAYKRPGRRLKRDQRGGERTTTTHGISNAALVNYSRLMDVADDFAELIRRQKIREAEHRHKRACAAHNVHGDAVLDFEALDEIVNAEWPKQFPEKLGKGTVSTLRLCELLRALADYKIYTSTHLRMLLSRRRHIAYIIGQMEERNVRLLQRSSVFFILCECHRRERDDVSADIVGTLTQAVVNYHISVLLLEEQVDQAFEKPEEHEPRPGTEGSSDCRS